MNTKVAAAVDAIRLAWGIGISEAEADTAACVIADRKLLRPGKPESYWSRALRNLMLDYARHSRVREHAVREILYPMIAINEADFRDYVETKVCYPAFREKAIADLRGGHLLCWCYQGDQSGRSFCHLRVWLEGVNQ
jgi:hypothetical protein